MRALERGDGWAFKVLTADQMKQSYLLTVSAHQSGAHVFLEFSKRDHYHGTETLLATVQLVEGLTKIYLQDSAAIERRYGDVKSVEDAMNRVQEAEERLAQLRRDCDKELARLESYKTVAGLSGSGGDGDGGR